MDKDETARERMPVQLSRDICDGAIKPAQEHLLQLSKLTIVIKTGIATKSTFFIFFVPLSKRTDLFFSISHRVYMYYRYNYKPSDTTVVTW